MRPLARVASIKVKLGLLIVAGIVLSLACIIVAGELGVPRRLGAAAAVVVSLGLVWILARGTTAPLREMTDAAEAMARGDHSVRVTARGHDEVARLADAFNAMASELASLDTARRDFVADAAHELRTPLTALRAQLENAVDGVTPADPAALLAQVERLSRLADQLLDLSRLDGADTLARRSFAVAELVDDVDADVDVPDGLRAVGDPVRLRQVLDNLLDNARRHAPGASVRVLARAGPDGGVRMEVVDDGPGLAPGDAERVFRRFSRGGRGGAGLGLAIARSIVELHGGSLRAEAAEPHGCRMVVSLPS